MPPALDLLTADGVIVPLIKPQFELRREEVGRGGIVRDPALHAASVARIRAFVEKMPLSPRADGSAVRLSWCGHIESPILGGEGNREFLTCLRATSA